MPENENEIKEIIIQLENEEVDLKNSMQHYNRMMHLNYHIQEQFRKKANEIKKSKLNMNKKNFIKN